jgi:tetratricopeptide (TPR) repeat protein
MEQSNFKDALECFIKSRKLGINNQDIVVYIANCHRKMGNKKKAQNILENFILSNYPSEDMLIELVLTLEDNHEKIKILEGYIYNNPLWDKAKMYLINSLINSKNYTVAQSFINEILKKEPENIKVIEQKMAILFEQMRLEEIDKYLSSLPDSILQHPNILYKRGLVKELQGQDGEAFTYYKKASETSENFELMLKIARLLWKQGSFYEAKEIYIKLINKNKNNIELKKELGCNLCKEEFYEEAIVYLNEAFYYRQNDPDILKSLGLALGERKNYNEALNYLIKYSNFCSDFDILKLIGKFYALSGNFKEAKIYLEKYVSAFPEDKSVFELLQKIISKLN